MMAGGGAVCSWWSNEFMQYVRMFVCMVDSDIHDDANMLYDYPSTMVVKEKK